MFKSFKKILFFNFLLLFTLAFNNNLSAQNAVPAAQKQQLINLISQFNQASQQRDIDKIVDFMPPHLFSSMSLRLGKTVEQLKANFKSELKKQLDQDHNANFKLESDKLECAFTKDGQLYALIPTIKSIKNQNYALQTLAIYENSNWHIIYSADKILKNPIFQLIYPSLSEIIIEKVKKI